MAFKNTSYGGSEVRLYPGQANFEDTMTQIVDEIMTRHEDDPFALMNLDVVCEKYKEWYKHLPDVTPFYAVKSNRDPVLVQAMVDLGVGFDCASKGEIDSVLDLDCDPSRIIYANPCKSPSSILYAKQKKVTTMTFDSADELEKILSYFPEAKLVLRITADDPTSSGALSPKFGADPFEEAEELLEKAKEYNLKVIGISFHIGAHGAEPSLFRTAIKNARRLTEKGRSLGFDMKLVDVGGGFPGCDADGHPFVEYAIAVNESMEEYFPEKDVHFISEPGRFFSAASTKVVACITTATEKPISKIDKNADPKFTVGMRYFINDGVFGVFRQKVTSGRIFRGHPLKPDGLGPELPSRIWGPTCHGLDAVEDHCLIRKMDIGEWMVYDDMGAYTTTTSTTFNGFPITPYYYAIGSDSWAFLEETKSTVRSKDKEAFTLLQ